MAGDRGAVILTGGRSLRMGRPKAWLEFAGVPALVRVARIVARVCSPVVVVGSKGQDLPALPGTVLRVDDPQAQRHGGPVVGLATGLAALAQRNTEVAFLSSCDAVLLDEAHIEFVLGRLEHSLGVDAVIPVDPEGFDQPLAAAVRVTPAGAALRALLEADDRRATALGDRLEVLRIRASELPNVDVLTKCNTPEQLAAVQARIGGASD